MIRKIQNLLAVARWLLDADADSYLIYQPGKVGSSAIEKALRKAGKKTFHVHQLKSHCVDFLPSSSLSRTKMLRRWLYLRITSWAFKRSKASVIVIVRDPVPHILSLTFHHLDKVLYLYFARYKDTRAHLTFVDILKTSYQEIVNVDYASDWLRDDFLSLTGLDQHKLSSATLPVQLSDDSGRRYLFMRYEDLEVSKDIFARFAGLRSGSLERVNHSSQKWYASLYDEAKSDDCLNSMLRQRLKPSLFMKTFYEG